MEIQFYHNPETGMPHCLDHNVREREVVEVLNNRPMRLHGQRGALFALGQTDSGRYLKVVYRLLENGDRVFVITAYDLEGKALAAYRRRRRRKGG